MLHAVMHKKAQKKDEPWTLEDNITSTFFGPLCFLPAHDVIKILGHTFPSIKESIANKGYEVVSFDFWPRIRPAEKSDRKGSIEPDLLIHFNKGSQNDADDFLLLVEVKWQGYKDARDKHQVHEQIDAIQAQLQPKEMKAIYLTQKDDKKPENLYKGIHIDCVKWFEVAQRHRSSLSDVSKGVQMWQAAVVLYLERILESLFYGFSNERFGKAIPPAGEKLFFSSFGGFSKPSLIKFENKVFFGE